MGLPTFHSAAGDWPAACMAAVGGAAVACLVCVLLVSTQRWHLRLTRDASAGVQKFHRDPTPRIGGLALLLGLTAAAGFGPQPLALLLLPMLLATLPGFLSGLGEDLTKRVSPRLRLAATLCSGALACGLTGVALDRTGWVVLDPLLGVWPVAVAFTAFAVAGVANAVNIVDGFHGLASGLVLLALAGLGVMAQKVGDAELAMVCLCVAGVVLGFMVLNFPMGRLFLGDGGAYALGIWLAWVAVLLIHRNPKVAPPAVLLVCAYPVVEVLFSIVRRVRRAHSPMHPDRLHLHSLLKCRVTRHWLRHASPVVQNAAVSPLSWALAALPVVAGVAFLHEAAMAYLGLLAFVGIYTVLYRRLALFGWR